MKREVKIMFKIVGKVENHSVESYGKLNAMTNLERQDTGKEIVMKIS